MRGQQGYPDHRLESGRSFRADKTPDYLSNSPESQHDLDIAAITCYLLLARQNCSDDHQAHPVDQGIRQHIQTVGYKSHRTGNNPRGYLHQKKGEIDQQDDD